MHFDFYKHKKTKKMRSYKTTLLGIITAAIVAIQPIIETGNIDWKKIGYAALIAAFGYVAKDFNVNEK